MECVCVHDDGTLARKVRHVRDLPAGRCITKGYLHMKDNYLMNK